jgi:RNA polymerase sigma-70 factor (ECF subfamily)
MELGDMARALRKLPDTQREALILVAAGGMSYQDAAKICDVAIGTVKSRVARARRALINILDGNDTLQNAARPAEGEAAKEIMSQLDSLVPDRKKNGV